MEKESDSLNEFIKEDCEETSQAQGPEYKTFSDHTNHWQSTEKTTTLIPTESRAFEGRDVIFNQTLSTLLMNGQGNHPDEQAYKQGAIAGARALDTFFSKLYQWFCLHDLQSILSC
jgi:hypothetical protein